MVMYNNKLVASIKVSGKVLREFGEAVKLPFGSEYSIFLKNLNSLRAIVRISIDGEDVAGDLVINANSSLDLERFIRNGNLDKGNKFKFIERTSKIEDHRGIQSEDGLIRVEYEFEKEPVKVVHEYVQRHYYPYYYDYLNWPSYLPKDNVWMNSGIFGAIGGGTLSASSVKTAVAQNSISLNAFRSTDTMSFNSASLESFNDAGITVPGSISEQKFTTVSGFATDGIKHVMVLRLLGENPEGKKITAPVTVKTKQKCPTCGTVNKATSKFCKECGTNLEIL